MRKIKTCLVALTATLLFAVSAPAAQKSSLLDQRLAELGYKQGPKADYIQDYRLDDRTYVNKKSIIVPDGASKPYLVIFWETCQGIATKRMEMRTSKVKGRLAKYDRVATRYETNDLAKCQVKFLYELEPI